MGQSCCPSKTTGQRERRMGTLGACSVAPSAASCPTSVPLDLATVMCHPAVSLVLLGLSDIRVPRGFIGLSPGKKKKTRHVTWVCRDREVPGTLLFCARLTYAEIQCQLVAGPQRPAEGELQQESLPSAHHQARRFVRIRVVLDRVLALQEVNVGDLQVALWKIACGEGEKRRNEEGVLANWSAQAVFSLSELCGS